MPCNNDCAAEGADEDWEGARAEEPRGAARAGVYYKLVYIYIYTYIHTSTYIYIYTHNV